ncbi:murein hydrolase activator EnvC family protein [Butyrivibrio sp. MC2013]|uniref:murein hydrolase activator EnvC family protein n=1 Tax=Butyrivibrio sp. MC2013 TaxID=1280686 RepID=UPI0003F66396|nr:peptidoglycan DD-metalloendopeptidase family protein [Butyrivibrio sp. MC2013]
MKSLQLRGRLIRVGIVLALCAGVVREAPVTPIYAATTDSIREKENKISQEKKERDNLKNSLKGLKDLKQKLESSKADINSKIKDIDAELTKMQETLDELEKKISEKEEEIAKTKKELEESQARQEAQYESMKKRIRFMYERGDVYMLEMVLEADNYSDMLNKAEYIKELSEYDQNKLAEYIETTELVKATKETLEEEQATLEEAKAVAEQDRKDMEAALEIKRGELAAVNGDIKDKDSAIAAYEAQIAEENATIAALEKAVAQEKAALNTPKRSYDGGMFTWPCPGYTRISDDYGMRMHPTLGIQKMHNGVDLAAPTGSSILAAYNGTVIAAAYSSSMGNYVMIDHGDGLYTVYMHASALYVSAGQNVTAGQNIAAVGSTGRSTGPHLHFGVRLNGGYVSPWNYLK